MKDWKLLTLCALTPSVRLRYVKEMQRQAAARYDPVRRVYERFRNLPAKVAAQCVCEQMNKPGWDAPPQRLVDEVCFETKNVADFLELCSQQKIDGNDYVSSENKDEVYAKLLELHALYDQEAIAKQAEAFCQSTREGHPCQAQ